MKNVQVNKLTIGTEFAEEPLNVSGLYDFSFNDSRTFRFNDRQSVDEICRVTKVNWILKSGGKEVDAVYILDFFFFFTEWPEN